MKKITLILSTLSLTILFNISVTNAQTTQEEYNYVTKGYQVQIAAGLDMKKGYTLVDLDFSALSAGTERRECQFKSLVKQGQTKPCAIMMIYKRTDISNGAAYYICIPSINSSDEIWNQTLSFITTTFKDNNSMMQTVIWSLMKLSAKEIAK